MSIPDPATNGAQEDIIIPVKHIPSTREPTLKNATGSINTERGKRQNSASQYNNRPSSDQAYPMTDVIWYLTTEMTVDDALTPIVDGVIGFDTEFDKRLPTREEKIIDILFKKVEGSKKAMLLALQVIKQETLVPFPVAWDNIALDSDRRCKARDGDLDAEQLTSAATDASVVLRLYPKLVIALENKQRELRLSIPRNWYSMDSRYGELMRRHPTIQGEILPWSVKDCYWYHAGKFQGYI
ncbi:hypothetical protein B0H17DRAFT_1138483 [Mycena rosella]|uniref:3'-5' exonuclease domain-containing protein n=1 Tax=Mycena rosella TaxID=1033263 RepID=A0AAD7D7N5_MYCRO|nr:hypothetical protein B0H17DRAFT_1138483 [Mycena rosella]